MQCCPATQVFLTLLKVSHKVWIDVSTIIVWAPDEDGWVLINLMSLWGRGQMSWQITKEARGVWGRQRHAVDNTSLRPFLTGSPWASGNSRTNNWALQRLFVIIHPWNPLLPIHTHNVPQMPWSTSWGPGPGYVRARNWLLLRFIFPSKHWWAT